MLNRVIEDDSTPTPNIGDALGQIREVAVHSHLSDLRQGVTPDREDAILQAAARPRAW